jgi:hypothetical protein
MNSSIISNNKVSVERDFKNPVKKVHSVSNKLFVVIDETIAKSLALSENDTWFEQIQIEDGILLRKHLRSQVSG